MKLNWGSLLLVTVAVTLICFGIELIVPYPVSDKFIGIVLLITGIVLIAGDWRSKLR